MTEQDFQSRLIAIADQAGAQQKRVDAMEKLLLAKQKRIAAMQARVDDYLDQELSRLFQESGWSVEKIAETILKSKDPVCKEALFGRLLYLCDDEENSQETPEEEYEN